MSTAFLTVVVVGPTAAVVVALFVVMWLEHRSPREAAVAIAAGMALAVWAVVAGILAAQDVFVQPDAQTTPPVGIWLLVVFIGLAVALSLSSSLRRLLGNQKHLIWLNLWRLEGIVFLLLMVNHQMPALWAWPSGIGDMLVGATAPWVAMRFDSPGGRGRAVVFNLFGLADLVVAIGLGMATNPGPAQLFHTTPTGEFVTHFPMALVPTFLVPLAFMVQVVSLWQLLGGSWSANRNVEFVKNS